MQFLTLSRRRTDAFPAEAFTPELVAQEAQRVKELYASGLLRQVWKRGDTPGATIIWEAAGEPEVRDAVASLPISKLECLSCLRWFRWSPYAGFGPTYFPHSGRSFSRSYTVASLSLPKGARS